ncbi:FliG C-terminal domain-containing protein [Jannaschia seohaensis]|uniref:Flagellar motor switch protein FliG n=1 Tax=Jannaschia seohaensis TaxID=475081 RepID=A0A2Y9ANI3_9RHOB|nr:FliG C-terminal domain-containing protein [Jannaschia seohaensis]PWJ19268.1 flagellar motor switch protein FliG [Jannaschia seohaensis]SSA45930.1 flagellar motor switch protein FliG [Jannaschia seohaensis]
MSQLTPLPGMATSPRLSPSQKAAVVVRLLMMGGADPGLAALPPDQQRRLVREMASLRFVDRQTLAEVIAEFSAELDAIGLHFPREIDKILQSMDGALSQEVVDALLHESGGDPALVSGAAWQAISTMDVDALVPLLAGETDEVVAIVVSKLAPDRAAALLAALPKDRADSVAAAFARTESVTPGAVARIGTSLGRHSAARIRGAFDSDAVIRIAAILNVATSALRNAVLDRLEAGDPDFAARVRAAIFTWENIPQRVETRDVPKLLRAIDSDLMIVAMHPPGDAAAEFILGSVSGRMADQLRDQIEEMTKPKPEAVEEARSKIVATIRELDDSGEINLLADEYEDPPGT